MKEHIHTGVRVEAEWGHEVAHALEMLLLLTVNKQETQGAKSLLCKGETAAGPKETEIP